MRRRRHTGGDDTTTVVITLPAPAVARRPKGLWTEALAPAGRRDAAGDDQERRDRRVRNILALGCAAQALVATLGGRVLPGGGEGWMAAAFGYALLGLLMLLDREAVFGSLAGFLGLVGCGLAVACHAMMPLPALAAREGLVLMAMHASIAVLFALSWARAAAHAGAALGVVAAITATVALVGRLVGWDYILPFSLM